MVASGIFNNANNNIDITPGETNSTSSAMDMEVSSTDANALFTGAVAYSGTIEIERSFDGGSTWMPVCLPNTFTAAKQTSGAAFTTTLFEPELGVLYRVACTAYTSGTINYRISAGALQTLAKW